MKCLFCYPIIVCIVGNGFIRSVFAAYDFCGRDQSLPYIPCHLERSAAESRNLIVRTDFVIWVSLYPVVFF